MNKTKIALIPNSKVFKKYKIIRILGNGGMGTVFLVSKLENEKELFALKYRHLDHNQDNQKRFSEEINIIKQVKSKHIPYYVEDYQDEYEQYYIMEYVKGKTLYDIIHENGYLTSRLAVNYIRQILEGIGELHALGIIHRDIKSHNILVNDEQKIKIIDLGISLTNNSQRITKANSIVCSSYYAAPEYLDKSKPINKTVDIYSIGIILYETLAGKYPFEGKSESDTILMHKNDKFPNILEVRQQREVPQSVVNIMLKATAKDPSKRYQSAWEMQIDLKTCLSSKRMLEKPINAKTTKPKKTWVDIVNSKAFLISAIAVIIVLIILSFVVLALYN
ncbi:serine/threonine-protein kinase [Mycoplasmopsis gallinacea]|uniref:Serine/threonine protein kinase n=1 Tax=Mycoplasmopsis gallinacea TaxID=29556 RepID=A0A449A2G2_9BACT|nr:serine/threonine-protein kinase [Mycoplasmopsis gallinacea]VEU58421.1 serine/threonine protein kinase [Mycoplasmopsis gallinacea]